MKVRDAGPNSGSDAIHATREEEGKKTGRFSDQHGGKTATDFITVTLSVACPCFFFSHTRDFWKRRVRVSVRFVWGVGGLRKTSRFSR